MLREIIQHEWEYQREQPFGRLVNLFVERIFRGGGDTDAEGLDLGVGLVLTFLAMPGGFVSVFLFDKYGSLLQWLRGLGNLDPLQIAFPDEYFFIVLSMTVTGAVAVWRWDAIFPDRRDYMNLAHLPISSRTIFLANLTAVLFLLVLVAIDVNAASCVLFPMVVSASQMTLPFFVKFGLVHLVGVLLGSVFSFLAVFSVLGLVMAIAPAKWFRRFSNYLRGIVVVYLVTLLCTSFAIPSLLQRLKGSVPAWTFLLPSCWLVSLCQMLRGRANPAMLELSKLCLPAIFGLVLIAFATYAISYQRHFVRIGEIADGTGIRARKQSWRLGFLDRLVLHSPAQRGCFRFVIRTMLRSEAQRLVMTGVAGLALVLASQALMNAFDGAKSARGAALTPGALSIPFIVTFLIVIGLRVVFEIPAELRANWIFQLTLDAERQECASLARKVILAPVLPVVSAITLGMYTYLASPWLALLHTALVVTWTLLLTDILLIRFRKLPFACSLPVFKQYSIVIVIAFCFGFLLYTVSTPDFESSALLHPLEMLGLLPVAAVAWLVPRYLDKNAIALEKRLIFEEAAVRTVERLRLSE
jgi:hypothetical protein